MSSGRVLVVVLALVVVGVVIVGLLTMGGDEVPIAPDATPDASGDEDRATEEPGEIEEKSSYDVTGRVVTFGGLKLRCVLSIKFIVGTVYLTLMCRDEVKHAEERLSIPAIAPVGLLAGLVPDVNVDEVVIFLGIVRAVITCFSKVFGEAPDFFRQFDQRT